MLEFFLAGKSPCSGTIPEALVPPAAQQRQESSLHEQMDSRPWATPRNSSNAGPSEADPWQMGDRRSLQNAQVSAELSDEQLAGILLSNGLHTDPKLRGNLSPLKRSKWSYIREITDNEGSKI